MKILFFVKQTFYRSIERMGIMYLSSVLKNAGHQVRLIRTSGLSFSRIRMNVKRYAPDIFAYSAMTGEHNYYINLNNKLKEEFYALSVFGGPHPTFFPSIIKEEGVDVICRGEGELAMLELANRLEQKKSIKDIKNLWIKEDNKVWENPLCGLLEDLDKIPFPDRELMYESDLQLKNYKSKVFMAGRGCPYDCAFCFNPEYNQLYKNKGKIIRKKSVDNLIREIVEVKKKYPLDFIEFLDDNFLLASQGWLEDFSLKFSEQVGLPFSCNSKANLINERTVEIFKRAGCYAVWMGVECGFESINREFLKRALSNEQILKACELLRQNGIRYVTQNIIGLPIENPLEIDLKTLEFNIKCKPDFTLTSFFFPYPGTILGDYSMQKGYFRSGNFNSLPENNKMVSPLLFKNKNEKKSLERLCMLFSITVKYPYLLSLTKICIFLPFDGLFRILFYLWGGFCYEMRIRKTKKNLSDIFRILFSTAYYLKGLKNKSEKRF